MREVWMQQLTGMDSPVRHVMRHVHSAIVNIAQEKNAEFARAYDELTLEYLDDHQWICKVDGAKRHIRISRKVMEVFWAASFMYIRFHDAISEETEQGRADPVVIDFEKSPRLREAARLFEWAINSWRTCSDDPWPQHLPMPLAEPVGDSDEDFAEDLSLRAVAFIVHHELAHIRLGHRGPSEVELERDADNTAAAWLLGDIDDEESDEFTRRALGVATALAVLVARRIHGGGHDGPSHPRAYDRLMHTLIHHIENADHIVWYFVSHILKLHLDNASHGAVIPEGPFNSGRECADAYVDALSRLGHQSS